jgi:hypothetical protein
MDFILFIKIIAWIGLFVSGGLAALSVINWYHYECTKVGELEKSMMRLKGYTIKGYFFMPRAIVFILCLAAIISFN